ncbi:MAG: hypothetical protein GYB36_04000 [Alphaproteobacteria bacterium]|nr:hypothetical protein [Alphaproteobacteria bacterium]
MTFLSLIAALALQSNAQLPAQPEYRIEPQFPPRVAEAGLAARCRVDARVGEQGLLVDIVPQCATSRRSRGRTDYVGMLERVSQRAVERWTFNERHIGEETSTCFTFQVMGGDPLSAIEDAPC